MTQYRELKGMVRGLWSLLRSFYQYHAVIEYISKFLGYVQHGQEGRRMILIVRILKTC